MLLKEIYVRGDTLDQVKFKTVQLVHDSYKYMASENQRVLETARELCIDPKTVKNILEGKGGTYVEVVTKIPAGKRDKGQSGGSETDPK